MREKLPLLVVALGAAAAAAGLGCSGVTPTEPSPVTADSGISDPGPAPDLGSFPADGGDGPDASDGRFAVTFRVEVPRDTPIVPEVHVAGDFQGWDPADPAHQLTRVRPGHWEGTFRLPPGPIAYKYVRGGWDTVEKGEQGEEIADRTASVVGELVLDDVVAGWADRPGAPSTITGDVRRLDALGRAAWVYLPPDYDEAPQRRFPVLYMFDGQNVFDARTSFAGEWQADEAAERLIEEGVIEPLIIVALENGGPRRVDEYTPWRDDDFGQPGGEGQAHLQAIVDELLPLIDRTFRTRTEPEDTGLCGSSLGGLMAAYGAYAHADEFGRIAAVSPSIWWDDQRLVRFVRETPKPATQVFHTDMGTLESGGIPTLRALREALLADGFVEGTDLFVEEIPGAGHNENAWRARFPDILRRLFPPRE